MILEGLPDFSTGRNDYECWIVLQYKDNILYR